MRHQPISIGDKFGRLEVTGEAEPSIRSNGHRRRCWTVECDCGTVKVVKDAALKCGEAASCGCAVQARNEWFDDGVTTRLRIISGRTGNVTEVLIDTEQRHRLEPHNWWSQNHYPAARIDGRITFMHRLLMPSPNLVDHINGNKLDNRPENLELLPSQAEHARQHSTEMWQRRKQIHG